MSIKKLFDKGKTSQVVTSTDLQNLSEDIESTENLKERFEDVNRFVPTVDFTNPENFARFGSAEKYYTDAMDRIVRYYPYDGSEAEQNEFRNESSYVDNHIFDNLYPRTTGFAKFSPHDPTNDNGGWGANDTNPAASRLYYGEPTIKEYIEVRGGPHTGSNGMLSGAIGISFTGSNFYSTDIYAQAGESHVGRDGTRESNLRMNLDDGMTVEFWLKKESFLPSQTQREVVFDLWNQVTSSSPQYGRFRVELTASGFAENGADPFRLTFLSGGVVQDSPNGSGFESLPLGGSTVTTSSVADNKWHHYAFSVVNERAVAAGTIVRFYRDGQLVDTIATGSVAEEVTGSLIGFIGALQTQPSRSAGSADSMVGWGKLSGSIDEFRYWKARRTSEQISDNYFTQVRGGTNTDIANTELGVYYKFNEGITGDASIDSTVLDYSGRISNGRWFGYAADARATGSAIIEYSGSTKTEYKDPIIYPSHPDVQTLRANLAASASYHDVRNNSSIFQSLPSWMIEDDDETGGQLKNLTQIIGNYFDTLYLQIEAIKDLHVPTYQTSSGKALPFANRLLESKGFINSEIFANAEVLEAVMNRDTEREYSADLHNIKNLIYQNIYNNLVHIFKTKGTEKSFHNLIRSFGVDEELIRINLYADNTTHLLRDNFRPKAVRKNFVDFYQSDNHDAVVTHDIRPSTVDAAAAKHPEAVGVTYISASHKDFSTTAEAEVIFPRLKEPGDAGFVELSFTDSSIFGWDQARKDPDNFNKLTNGSGYQVLAIRPSNDSKDAFFKLVDRFNNNTIATSSLFKDVYDDNRWVFALRTRNVMTSSIAPSAPNVSHGMGTFLTGAAGIRAKAVDCIDLAGVEASSADVSFTILIPTSAGGEHDTTAVTILLDDSATTDPAEGANTIAIGTAGISDADKTAAVIDAINGVASSLVDLASSGVGANNAIGVQGVTAKAGSTNTKITLSIDLAGAVGNLTNAITAVSGVDVVDLRSFSGGLDGTHVEVSLYGVHTAYDRVQEEFSLSGNAIHSDITVPRRYYVGARRDNFVGGTIHEQSSVKVGYLRHWQMYLNNHVIQAHSRDSENYGTFNPFRSTYLLENPLTGTYLPEIQTLSFNWDFSNITGSDASGEFKLEDFSSGSLLKRRFRDPDIDPIVNNQYLARGHFFKTSTTAAVDTNYVSSARYRLPETLTSYDMIDIRTQDDLTFTKETRPISHFFAFEKSMYQAISEEMINMFAGINEFNNLIGEPVNKYRYEYKDMSKLRQIFYENVENTPDLDKYLSYYKWLDTALGEMLQQLVPASSRFSDDIRNVIEDTALTRNKYRHILPTLRTPKLEIEGHIKGIEEMLYRWDIGHAPMNNKATKVVHPQPEDKNCLWWRQRAERQGASVTSDRASVDRSVAQVAIIDEQRNIYKKVGYSYISASVPQFTALQGTDGATKVGINNVPIYTGSYYPNNRFSRVYRLFVGTGFSSLSIIGAWNGYLIAGHNPTSGENSKYTFWRTSTNPVDSTRLIEVSNIIDQTGCEYKNSYVVLPPKFPSKDLIAGGKKKLDATATSSPASKARDLPFSLYMSDVTTGYKSSIAHVNVRLSDGSTSLGKLELNNIHQDIYESGEDTLQGPFTKKYVGGLPHRHVDLNTSKGVNAVSATATITTTGGPLNNETFALTDAAGLTVGFIFKHSVTTVDGTKDGDNVIIGVDGALGSAASVGERIRDAINASSVAITATEKTGPLRIALTQDGSGASGNTTINMSGVTTVTATNFTGGTTLDGPTNRLEGFKLSFTADTISVSAPLAASDDRGSANPEIRGDFYRNVKTKRPLNIANIRQLTGSHQLNHIGNFSSFREIIQISDRDINNRSFVKHEGKGPFRENSRTLRILRGFHASNPFALLGEFKDVAKPSFYISGSSHRENDIISLGGNQFAESNTTDYIFVERFSAPGGPETAGDSMGGAALDYGSAQYSPYNNINYRNLSVRLPLRKLLADHTAQFGYRSDERHRDTPIYAPSQATSNQYTGGVSATATITIIDSGSPPGVPFIGEGDTIELVATDGTKVTLTMQGTGGTTTSSETSGTTLTAKTLSPGSYASTTLHATAQAVEIRTAINNHTKFTATNNANIITIVQAEGGVSGNTTITITELGATGMSNTNFSGGSSQIPAFHKVNRNSTLRFESSGSRTTAETVIRKKVNDNFFVQREIPSTTTRYAWITGSLTHIPGHQTTVLGHPRPDGTVSSSVSFDYGLAQGANGAIAGTLKSVGPGDIPALNFVSASDIVTRRKGSTNLVDLINVDKRSADPSGYSGLLPVNFVGMNQNVRQVINTGSLILSGAGPGHVHAQNSAVGRVFADHTRIGTAPFYKATELYLNRGDTSTFLFAHANTSPQALVLNMLNLNRNGPYGYPSFKQIRTGETRVGRYLRRNNIISFNESPGRHFVTEDAGRGRIEVIERFSKPKLFREPPVTSRHKPTEFVLGFAETYEEEGREVTAVRPVDLQATYGNEMGFFGNVGLDIALGRQKLKPVGYQTITDFYLRGGLESPSTPIESFIEFKYTDTVYPKERNTYTFRARTRTGFQNNFWRDGRSDRFTKGAFKASFNGASAAGSATARVSSWNLDAVPESEFTVGPVGVADVMTGSGYETAGAFGGGTGLLQNPRTFLHFGNATNTTASAMYARPHMLETSASVRSLTGPAAVIGEALVGAGKPLGRVKIFGGMTMWDAGRNAGSVKESNIRPDKTYEFKKIPTTPFYDSYEDYSEDLRVIAQDYAVIPEFRISEHMDFYVKGADGNFLAPNPRILSVVHSERDLAKPDVNTTNSGRKLRNPYLDTEADITDLNFFTVYSNSDFMKNFAEIREEHSELANPTEIKLTCKAAMKFLPYDGFYPAERTFEIAQQFSQSYGANIAVTGAPTAVSDKRGAALRPITQPLFAPGIMFNTIKSGMAVDYPIYTGPFKRHNPKDAGSSNVNTNYVMMSTASSPNLDDNGKIAGWDFRLPFETLVEPERYLTDLTLVDMEVHPSSALPLTASWNGHGDRIYKMMANNFFAAVPEFFLPNGEFSTLKSKPQKQFKGFDTGSIYGLRIKLRKSYNRGRQPDRLDSYIVPQDMFNDANAIGATFSELGALRETFTMYSRPSAFGPPMSGRHTIGATGSSDGATYERLTFSRQHIADSLIGLNPSFTPPYYDGEAWCDVLFRPSSSFATLGDILAESKKVYWRFDNLALGSAANDQPYGNLNINKFAMQLTASFNLFQKVQEPSVTFDESGRALSISEGSDEKSVWVIQPKFETPMFNFNDTFGVNPIVAGSNFTVPINNSESVARGIWHQFGAFPTDPQEGIFLDIEPIPDNFINNRVRLYVSGSPGRYGSGDASSHPSSLLNDWSYDDTNYAGFYGGYHGVAASSSSPVLSLLDVVEFDQKSMRLGETANKLKASEAVVAIPFIEEAGERKFFKVDKELVQLAIDNPETEEVGESIKHMIRSVDKYVMPPTMDFVAFRDEVDPIAMYFFEFEFEFDKNDLAHMWQNLMPPSGKIVKKAETTVGHKLILNEMLGLAASETGRPLEDQMKWMVFKVKQRANMNYFSKVAGADTDADDRYRFEFKAGRASEEALRQGRFGFNWPFDFFSMVELIKLESEIKFSGIDESIDSELVTSSERDLVSGGITPDGTGPSSG